MNIMTEISPGELIDKLTILQIKMERINDEEKLKNVRIEYDILQKTSEENITKSEKIIDLTSQLKAINEKLWEIEDNIRDCEREKDFGDKFIGFARSVYFTNDERSRLKKEINMVLGSSLIEEKSYSEYA